MLLTEDILTKAVLEVLKENRKVLRVGSSQSSAPSMPPMQDPIMGDMSMQGPNMGMPQDMGMDGQQTPNMSGEMMDNGAEQNQFDTNFDAGVEADEETDPKRYIQQLTGKLSQSLNSFNEENGPDAGLSKYVASMIIAAACKNLDKKAKKELIEKINTTSSDEDTEEPVDDGSMPPEDVENPEQQEQPMMERILTKKELHELAFGTTKKREDIAPKPKTDKKSIFSGKSF